MLFIYRDTVGIHIIEGSDSTLLKHIKLIFANTEVFGNAKNVVCKLVAIQTHINTRLLPRWTSMEIISSYPSETIIMAPEEEEIYSFYKTLVKNLADANELLMNNSLEQQELLDGGYIFNLMCKILPPAQMLHRLLYTPILEDLKIFRNETVTMPKVIPYHEVVWPLPVDYVPHHSEVLLMEKCYLDEKK
ncbi:uncharacterized protein LOC142326418 [Lycorma delicatula]|uniref:uncharacterized protein LOC142326418 n=1 Tax=Lycorma delicatula TaxID=130591 RepID=UPI003F516C1A